MKKIVLFILMMLLIMACSSDKTSLFDDTGKDGEKIEIKLTAKQLEIPIGTLSKAELDYAVENIYGEPIELLEGSTVEVYVNEEKVDENFVLKEAGEYIVYFKINNNISNKIILNAVKTIPARVDLITERKKTETNKYEVKPNNIDTFLFDYKIYDQFGNEMNNAENQIYINNIKYSSKEFKTNISGIYNIVVKSGDALSNILSVYTEEQVITSIEVFSDKKTLIANGIDELNLTYKILDQFGNIMKNEIADIYVSNEKIVGNVFATTENKTFNVYAKIGNRISNTLTISTVKYSEVTSIELKSDKSAILSDDNDSASFEYVIKDQYGNVMKNVGEKLYINDNIYNSNVFKTNKAGVYKFHVQVGLVKSNNIYIKTIKEIRLELDKTEIKPDNKDEVNIFYTIIAEDDSEVIDKEAQIYINDVILEGSKFLTNKYGTYKVLAKLGDLKSNEELIKTVDPTLASLELIVDKTQIDANGEDEVTFTYVAKDQFGYNVSVMDVEIYQVKTGNHIKLTSNKFTTDKIGIFVFYVKSGDLKSRDLIISTEEQVVKSIELSSDKKVILPDNKELVSFDYIVKDQYGNNMNEEEAIIYINEREYNGKSFNSGIDVKYKKDSKGEYKVRAKIGNIESNTIIIETVKELVLILEKLMIEPNEKDSIKINYIIKDGYGNKITDKVAQIYINDVNFEGTEFKTNKYGTYKVVAKLGDLKSNEEVIRTVDPVLASLELNADKTQIDANGEDEVTFTYLAKDQFGYKLSVMDVEIYQVKTGNHIKLTSDKFTTDKIGIFVFYVKSGDLKSGDLIISTEEQRITSIELSSTKDILRPSITDFELETETDEAILSYVIRDQFGNTVDIQADIYTIDEKGEEKDYNYDIVSIKNYGKTQKYIARVASEKSIKSEIIKISTEEQIVKSIELESDKMSIKPNGEDKINLSYVALDQYGVKINRKAEITLDGEVFDGLEFSTKEVKRNFNFEVLLDGKTDSLTINAELIAKIISLESDKLEIDPTNKDIATLTIEIIDQFGDEIIDREAVIYDGQSIYTGGKKFKTLIDGEHILIAKLDNAESDPITIKTTEPILDKVLISSNKDIIKPEYIGTDIIFESKAVDQFDREILEYKPIVYIEKGFNQNEKLKLNEKNDYYFKIEKIGTYRFRAELKNKKAYKTISSESQRLTKIELSTDKLEIKINDSNDETEEDVATLTANAIDQFGNVIDAISVDILDENRNVLGEETYNFSSSEYGKDYKFIASYDGLDSVEIIISTEVQKATKIELSALNISVIEEENLILPYEDKAIEFEFKVLDQNGKQMPSYTWNDLLLSLNEKEINNMYIVTEEDLDAEKRTIFEFVVSLEDDVEVKGSFVAKELMVVKNIVWNESMDKIIIPDGVDSVSLDYVLKDRLNIEVVDEELLKSYNSVEIYEIDENEEVIKDIEGKEFKTDENNYKKEHKIIVKTKYSESNIIITEEKIIKKVELSSDKKEIIANEEDSIVLKGVNANISFVVIDQLGDEVIDEDSLEGFISYIHIDDVIIENEKIEFTTNEAKKYELKVEVLDGNGFSKESNIIEILATVPLDEKIEKVEISLSKETILANGKDKYILKGEDKDLIVTAFNQYGGVINQGKYYYEVTINDSIFKEIEFTTTIVGPYNIYVKAVMLAGDGIEVINSNTMELMAVLSEKIEIPIN